MKNFISPILMSLLLAACSSSGLKARQQQQEWQVKLDALPLGATAVQVEQWAQQNQISLQPNAQKDKTVYYASRSFPSKGLDFCAEWRVVLAIELNEMYQVQKKDVTRLGVCL